MIIVGGVGGQEMEGKSSCEGGGVNYRNVNGLNITLMKYI